MSETAKIVRFHELGGPEVLRIEELPMPQPGQGEVRLRVKAIGLNRAELLFCRGRYLIAPELPSKLGYEASGIVEAVGPGVDPGLIGKKMSSVPGFAANEYGVYGEVAILPASAMAEYPAKLSYEEATSIWMQYMTAYGALVHFGRMGAGDFVLITAASSSVGLAAIEIARAEGAVPIAATRTAKKKAALLEAGAHAVIVTDEEDIVARTNEITGGKGARLIFDPVAGPGLESLVLAAARGGTIFEYGNLSGKPTPYPLLPALLKSLVIQGYTLFPITSDPELRKEAEQYVYAHVEAGDFKPRIDRTFPLAEIAEAHRYMERNEQIGKIVVTV
jgi:NADPH:quinone reductase-like Zn-dependent oxidoreductase